LRDLDPDVLIAALLTTRLAHADVPTLSPRAWHQLLVALRDRGCEPKGLLDPDADLLSMLPSDSAERVRVLLQYGDRVTAAIDSLAARGISVHVAGDEAYPQRFTQRLGQQAPPVVFAAGSTDLVSGPSVGIVGSRDVTEEGAAAASELAEYCARRGWVVVSGGARGVDKLAMAGSFRRDGSVIGILADSLDRQLRHAETGGLIEEGRLCLLTQQHPEAGFSVGAAMARNKLIYALSNVTVVVSSDRASGGTWSGATEALRKAFGTVAVWRGEGEGPGNPELANMGAEPISSAAMLDGLVTRGDPQQPEQLAFPG
jgi:predicted Rossmann fold nucleotide-binding protein DprA/Smf involved in DNA uptake